MVSISSISFLGRYKFTRQRVVMCSVTSVGSGQYRGRLLACSNFQQNKGRQQVNYGFKRKVKRYISCTEALGTWFSLPLVNDLFY